MKEHAAPRPRPRHPSLALDDLEGVRLQAILDGLLDPVLTIDRLGTIQLANRSCEGVFGYALEELVGHNIKLLMPEPYRSEHDDYLAEYQRTGATKILGRIRTFPVVRKDGQRILVELSVARIDMPNGMEAWFTGSFRDVTERVFAQRALAASEHRFHAIFDQVRQFVALLTPDGIVQEINRSALESLQLRREDVVGRPFWLTPWWTHDTDQQARLRESVRRAAAGESARFETHHVFPGACRATFDFSIQPLTDEHGEVALLLPEGHDITEIRTAQERELAMSRAFAEIGESASLLAHEIKNPITAVNAALRAVAGQLQADEQVILEELADRMQRLERLMKRTLSLAKPLELDRREVDVAALLAGTVERAAAHGRLHGTSLDWEVVDGPLHVRGDVELLEEALANLVLNGIDALEERGGRVRLSALASDGRVTIRVDDDGPGLPEGQEERIFQSFVSNKRGGTGLGLALTRKIVRAHGGAISASASPEGGARFEFWLPLQPGA